MEKDQGAKWPDAGSSAGSGMFLAHELVKQSAKPCRGGMALWLEIMPPLRGLGRLSRSTLTINMPLLRSYEADAASRVWIFPKSRSNSMGLVS